jgi:DNA-binding transcriptional ArsR family regulator
MARLLPSRTEAPERDPEVVGLDGEAAEDLVGALQAETARELLSELYEEPAAPSELADRVDTSLQNAQYHLEKLEDADLIEVADTVYSEKGREMRVFAPANSPLVMVAGHEEQTSTLRTALGRLLGAVGVLAAASVGVQVFLGDRLGDAGGSGGVSVQTAESATESAPLFVQPGVLFFVGGLVALAGVVAYARWRAV